MSEHHPSASIAARTTAGRDAVGSSSMQRRVVSGSMTTTRRAIHGSIAWVGDEDALLLIHLREALLLVSVDGWGDGRVAAHGCNGGCAGAAARVGIHYHGCWFCKVRWLMKLSWFRIGSMDAKAKVKMAALVLYAGKSVTMNRRESPRF